MFSDLDLVLRVEIAWVLLVGGVSCLCFTFGLV